MGLICEAIKARKQLSFRYEGRDRIVAPFLCGEHKDGHMLLIAWCLQGSKSTNKPDWRTYSLDEMSSIQILKHEFIEIPTGYNRNDERFERIDCRV